MKINFEGAVASGSMSVTKTFVAIGNSAEELFADAARKATALGLQQYMAVGLHNVRSEFEAAFGPSAGTFGDDPGERLWKPSP